MIAVATAIFFVIQPSGDGTDAEEFAYRQAAIACELTTGEALSADEIINGHCAVTDGNSEFGDKSLVVSVIVSMFLHAGFLHLAGNMWSLWIFGNNVEDAFGSLGYLMLYFASGVAATAGFVLLNPETTVPLVGASGAISGVMGAYLVLFPRARVVSVFPILFFLPIALPASIFLFFWFAGQFALIGQAAGIAWEAHVAGFLFGAMVALVLHRPLLARIERLRNVRTPAALHSFTGR